MFMFVNWDSNLQPDIRKSWFFFTALEIRECSKDEFLCRSGQCIDAAEQCLKIGIDRSGCADKSHLQNCRKSVYFAIILLSLAPVNSCIASFRWLYIEWVHQPQAETCFRFWEVRSPVSEREAHVMVYRLKELKINRSNSRSSKRQSWSRIQDQF